MLIQVSSAESLYPRAVAHAERLHEAAPQAVTCIGALVEQALAPEESTA